MGKRLIAISQPDTGEEEWLAVREPLMSGWLTQGPRVDAFEKAFAERHAVTFAIATTSCTTGLHLILVAMGIGPGDEVIVPAFTWVATANVVVYCGATPVFADVDPITFNIDPQDVARKVTPRTKAVIAVHLFGMCADMDALKGCLPNGIPVIEDAACASGAVYKGRFSGSIGLAAAFSFHPRKTITTGEGGMVTTNNESLAELIQVLRNHGAAIPDKQSRRKPCPYLLPEFNLLGYNYRMTDMQGAFGLVQLGKLDGFIREREEWATYYAKKLCDISWLRLPGRPRDGQHAWQAYVTWVDPEKAPMSRNAIMERLQYLGVSTRPGTHAVHMLGYYRDRYNLHSEDCPNAKSCSENTMAIPLHNKMNKDDFDYVIKALRKIQ